MAMATVVLQHQPTLRHSTPPPSSKASALPVNRRSSPIPNKQLPVCPTGPIPSETPAASPVAPISPSDQPSSLLYPPDRFTRLSPASSHPVYAIDADTLAIAQDHLASQALPDPSQMFPWLHGLHPDNHLQWGFFGNTRRRSLRRAPKCWRGITVVKLGGDLSKARIKGAVSAGEVLSPSSSRFLMADPPDGFSVRNFQIQTAKLAPMSDIVIYGEDGVSKDELLALAEQFAVAQHAWRLKHDPTQERPAYNTFVVSSGFARTYPCVSRNNPDFLTQVPFPRLRRSGQT